MRQALMGTYKAARTALEHINHDLLRWARPTLRFRELQPCFKVMP